MFAAGPLMAGLGLSPGDFAFAYTLYGVTSIFMLYKHRWMVERLGYRSFILLSLAVFALGGWCCTSAEGLPLFALGRAIQGLGGATFFTAGRMTINTLPESRRLAGLLTFVASLLGASAIAPLLAAGLLALGDWPALFWFVLPLSAGVAWIAAPALPRTTMPPAERSHEHWGWLLWMALGVFGLQYAIQDIPASSAGQLRPNLLIGAASIAILSLFAWRQWCKERPLIDYRGLFQWRYLTGIALYFGGYFMAGASGFMIPIFFQRALGHSLLVTAAATSLCLFASVTMALVHIGLARRWPVHRLYMFCGLACYALGNLLLSHAAANPDWLQLLPPLVLCGVAVPLFIGPVAGGTFSELHAKVFSHGYQVKNIVRQLGLSSSIGLATLALQAFYTRQGPAPAWEAALHRFVPAATGGGNPLAAACGDVFLLLALLTLPLALAVAVQRVFR